MSAKSNQFNDIDHLKRTFKTVADRQHAGMWGLVKKNMTDQEFREWIFELTGGKSESSSDLSFDQKNYIISKLGGTPFESKQKRRTQYFPNVKKMVTKEQLDKIDDLCTLKGIGKDGLKSLCNRMLKVDHPRTVSDGQKIIEAIKAMIEREQMKEVA